MRILYSHYLTDANHPAARMAEQIAAELRLLGHEVLVHASAGLATKSGAEAAAGGALSRPSRLRRWLWFAKEMARNAGRRRTDARAIEDFRPDVVLARQDAYCWSVARQAARAGVPLVTYADAPVAYECRVFDGTGRWHPPGLVESIERWGLQHSRAIITPSHPAARRLQTYHLPTPISVAHNGVNPREFGDVQQELRDETRRSLNLEGQVVLGFQGTFKAFHGIDRLRDLIAWSAQRQDATWLLIGDGPERRWLEESVGHLPRIRFLGRQPAAEVPRLLSAVDIAVAPHARLRGDFYFCPLKILEYAASGCAIVASYQGDIPLLLDDGRCGLVVRDDRFESWAHSLQWLLDHADERRRLGARARAHVLNHLTWRHTALEVERVLRESLSQQSLSRSQSASTPPRQGAVASRGEAARP